MIFNHEHNYDVVKYAICNFTFDTRSHQNAVCDYELQLLDTRACYVGYYYLETYIDQENATLLRLSKEEN